MMMYIIVVKEKYIEYDDPYIRFGDKDATGRLGGVRQGPFEGRTQAQERELPGVGRESDRHGDS